MGQRRTNVSDVAVEAGVSRASAARVLGGYGYASPEVQRRVLEAAQRLNYSPDKIARTMRSGRSETIGFICADIALDFFSSAMRGICDVANSFGYQVIATNSDDRMPQEQAAAEALAAHKIDGLIISPISVSAHDHIDRLVDSGVPVVSLDRQLRGAATDSVLADNEAAAFRATQHLIDLGHERIGYLASAQPEEPPRLRFAAGGGRARITGPSRPASDRARGYLRALNQAGLAIDRSLVSFVSQHRPEERERAVAKMLDSHPTALFAADSYLAKSTFSVLAAHGIAVPSDITLLCFDDQEWTHMVTPKVSVVVQSAYDMGRVAAERLLRRLEGDAAAPSTTTVPTRYVERDSVAPPRRQGTRSA